MAAPMLRRFYNKNIFYFSQIQGFKVASCRCSSSQSSQTTSTSQYCNDLVRDYDYENFICVLALPKKVRRAGMAIRAFNVEIAQVGETTTDTQIGKLRMLWWKDAIDKMYKGENPPPAPVSLELEKVIKKFELSKTWFERIISKREELLKNKIFRTVAEAEEYAEHTVSSILYLYLELLGIKNTEVEHAVSHIGKAVGLTTMIRATPHNACRNRIMLPRQLLIKHSVPDNDILRGRRDKPVQDVIHDLSSVASNHLEKARSLKKSVPRHARAALVSAVPCGIYLDRLKKTNFDIFDPKLQLRDGSVPLKVYINKLIKSY